MRPSVPPDPTEAEIKTGKFLESIIDQVLDERVDRSDVVRVWLPKDMLRSRRVVRQLMDTYYVHYNVSRRTTAPWWKRPLWWLNRQFRESELWTLHNVYFPTTCDSCPGAPLPPLNSKVKKGLD